MTLGNIIQNYRIEHSMSMDKFAEISGISKGYISMLEKNRDQRGNEIKPSIDVIDKVANAIKKPFDEVLNMLDNNLMVTVNSVSKNTMDFVSDEINAVVEAYKNADDEVKHLVQYALNLKKTGDKK